jgi:predicted MFS family arabinose efflux permease
MADPICEAELVEPAPTEVVDEAAGRGLYNPAFVALLVAQASFGFAFSSFLLLPKFLDTELAAGPFEIGLLMALYGAVVVVFVPLMGSWVDRYGRRDFMTAGALLMAASSLGFAQVDSAGSLLFGLRALQGIAFAMVFAAGAALTVDLAPPERMSQAIGVFGLTFLSMNAIAPATVEEIAGRAGWSSAFVLAAAGALLCAVLSRRIPNARLQREPDARIPGLWSVATQPRLMRMMVVVALMGVAMGSLFIFHQPFAREVGIERLRGFFIAYALSACVIRGGLGSVADRVGHHRVAIAAMALYVVVVTSTVALQPGWLPLLGAGLGIAHGFAYPALNAIAVQETAADERGKAMSLFQAAFNVGFAGVSLLLGTLAERHGYPSVFLVGGICALSALVVLTYSPEGRAPRADTQ